MTPPPDLTDKDAVIPVHPGAAAFVDLAMHLAAAAGIPTFVLFGAESDPDLCADAIADLQGCNFKKITQFFIILS